MPRSIICASLFLVVLSTSLLARDEEAVTNKLNAAKMAYETELKKFDKSVKDYFDGLENQARKDGNKKALDAVKIDRDIFITSADLPKKIPLSYTTRQITMRRTMAEAYKNAVRDYTKNGSDELATKTEKEMQSFLTPKGKGDDEPGRISPGEYVQLDDKDQPMNDFTMTVTRVTPNILELRGNNGWVGYASFNADHKGYYGFWEWQSYKGERSPGGKFAELYSTHFYHSPEKKVIVLNGNSVKSNSFRFHYRPKP
ncbi:MAG: hypothetical protein ACRC8S_11370 [Fimbriiglobus sp.]